MQIPRARATTPAGVARHRFTARLRRRVAKKKDRYGRDVCRVYIGGENVATLMLRAGFGCIYKKYENESLPEDKEAARKAVAFAQENKVGMWGLANPVCPFNIRHPG